MLHKECFAAIQLKICNDSIKILLRFFGYSKEALRSSCKISATILQFALRIWCSSTFLTAPIFSDLPPSLQSRKLSENTGHLHPLFIILSARNSSRTCAQKYELKSRCSEVSYSRDSARLFMLILLDSAAIFLRFRKDSKHLSFTNT